MNLPKIFFKNRGLFLDKYQSTFLSTRVWNLFGYLISFFFIANFLTQIEQGYYYTLNSLIALQVFFELGFSYVIVQKSSALFSIWKDAENDTLSEFSFSSISSFFYYIIQWFSISGLLLIIVLIFFGNFFFSKDTSNVVTSMNSLWYILVLLTSLNLFLSACLSFFEGFGKAIIVYKIKLFQNIASQVILWTSLFFGASVYSIFLSNFTLFSVGLFFVFKFFFTDIILLFNHKKNMFLFWFKSLFKYQSKVALSWISGYFQFQLLVPIIFKFSGAVDAGRMGNTFTIVSGITALSLSVIQSKSWEYSSLIAVQKYDYLIKNFKKHFLQCISISIFLGIGLFIFVVLLNYFEIKFAAKIIPPIPFLFFIIATVFNVVVGCYAIFLRSFLEEKLLFVSIFTGISMISLLYIFTPHFGLMGVASVYLFCNFIFGFLGSFFVFKSKVSSVLLKKVHNY